MTNYLDKFNNRKLELQQIKRNNTCELPIVPISSEIKNTRLLICNDCKYRIYADKCKQNNCFIDILVKSPALTCPENKWEAVK
jgi:hypothetical protein